MASYAQIKLQVAMKGTYWLAEDALKFRELYALARLHVMGQKSYELTRNDSLDMLAMQTHFFRSASPCGARALRVASTWSTSEKSGAFSPTVTFLITNPLDVRTRSGAGLGAIRVNAPLMLGAKPDAAIFPIFNV